MKLNKGKLFRESAKCAERSLEMLPVKITHIGSKYCCLSYELVCPKYIRRYGEGEKGFKMSTKYEEEVLRKLEGREQRIEKNR